MGEGGGDGRPEQQERRLQVVCRNFIMSPSFTYYVVVFSVLRLDSFCFFIKFVAFVKQRVFSRNARDLNQMKDTMKLIITMFSVAGFFGVAGFVPAAHAQDART